MSHSQHLLPASVTRRLKGLFWLVFTTEELDESTCSTLNTPSGQKPAGVCDWATAVGGR